MIDTVVMTIPMQDTMSRGRKCDGRQEWAEWEFDANRRGFARYIKRPPADELAGGGYFPRLTGYVIWRDKNRESLLNIEFSAPKLVYGHNLDELTDAHFETVIALLQDRMARMGVDVSDTSLRRAEISKIHYAKNLLLTDGFTASYAIGQLRKINLNKRIGHTNMRYANDGEGIQWYTKSYMITVYDKLSELRRELGENALTALPTGTNVVRLEMRLTHKAKVRSLMSKLGFNEAPTFRNMFSAERSRSVLLHYWEQIVSKDAVLLFARQAGAHELLRDVLLLPQGKRRMAASKAVRIVGLMLLSRDAGGMGELRSVLATYFEKATWYRYVRELRDVAHGLGALHPEEWYRQMDEQLRSYRQIKLLGRVG